jgi:hypothetical protein
VGQELRNLDESVGLRYTDHRNALWSLYTPCALYTSKKGKKSGRLDRFLDPPPGFLAAWMPPGGSARNGLGHSRGPFATDLRAIRGALACPQSNVSEAHVIAVR